MFRIFPEFEDKNIQIKHDTLTSFALFLFVQTAFTGYSTYNAGSDKIAFLATTLTSFLVPTFIILLTRKNYFFYSRFFVALVWTTSTIALFSFKSDNSGMAYFLSDLFIKSALASLTIRWYAGIFYGIATLSVGIIDLFLEKNKILNFIEVAPIPPLVYLIGYSIMLGMLGIVAATNAFSFEKIFNAYQFEFKRRKEAENQLVEQNKNLDRKVKERTTEIETLNEELRSLNSHLFHTNEEINQKNEELSVTLEKLQVTQEQLIQSEKMASLGVLASGIAHEINNPLNFVASGIFSLETYVEDNEEQKNPQMAKILNVLKTGLERASAIISSLSRYSRKDGSERTICLLHDIIDSCLLMLQSQTKHRIEIEKNYLDGDIELTCNENQMHQAFLNILSNAIQAIEGKGKISIQTKKDKNWVVVNISDNGCGISKENLTKIFDPFYTTKEPGKGTGLGLSITYKILKDHHANIKYQSEPGKGTTVTVLFPISENNIH